MFSGFFCNKKVAVLGYIATSAIQLLWGVGEGRGGPL